MRLIKKQSRYIHLAAAALIVLSLSSFKDSSNTKEAILKRIKAPTFPYKEIKISDLKSHSSKGKNWKPAFDKAMALSKKHKGSRIIVPADTYYVKGPIHFEENTELHLEAGAVLLFSAQSEFYLPVVKTSWEGTFVYNYSPFIYAYQKKNIAITGQGIIKADSADVWARWRDKQKGAQEESRDMNHKSVPLEKRIFGKGRFLRPHLVQFFECENILIENIQIEDSPFWCIHLVLSKNITVKGIKFNAHNLNNDGVDPEYSEDVLIENISFNNGDDNIAIKAGRDHDGRNMKRSSCNIAIRNCRFKGLHGVVIGSEMSAGVHHVYIDDCSFAGWLKRGIYVKSNADRGGEISHIYANNISFGEMEDCIYITSKYKNEGQGYFTDIHDIYLSNIKCQKATGHGIFVEGFAEKRVHDLFMSNISFDSVNIPTSITNAEKIKMDTIYFGEGIESSEIKK